MKQPSKTIKYLRESSNIKDRPKLDQNKQMRKNVGKRGRNRDNAGRGKKKKNFHIDVKRDTVSFDSF